MSDVRDGAATITPLGAGRYRITRQGLPSKILLAVPAPEGVWVWEDGRAMLVRPARETDGPNDTRDDDLSLATPMPATVRAIAVHEGDTVAEGSVLVLLEAMKMELAIKAPRAGRIKTIRCKTGELVQPGTPLVELE